MSSSSLTGERRWTSARRGGMTVLGKVAVPKPLNLPSQRLENHGLDPNVEIVPKGTLSWGSRPSSSGSNAWASSSLSPSAGGGTTSPSHLSGRPSSGGSGTRPSTAGSDRTHEAVGVWSSNSRPSSASGQSNQTSSTPLRPRSAETRPNSSQLSRFAEPVSESPVAWGPSVAAERLGVKSSKEDGFSLSSGDFPTLGSEKDNPAKTIELEDHRRPGSASSRISQSKEDPKCPTGAKYGTTNTWRTDGPHNAEDDIHPSVEKWQGDPQQYFNGNVPPQHFDAWRGPPMNAPPSVWYHGRPPGPAFRAPPLGPGGFPMEPYPYYGPQIPPPPLAGPRPAPRSGAGPRGPHPKNGDIYRPQMPPDAYARPGMPFRPGFYPGPRGPPGPVTFDSYYGPPMGYGNNERDIPYMSMGAGPPVYNSYPGPGGADSDNSLGRARGRGPAGKMLPEQVGGSHLDDKQGTRRVPLKNHDDWDQKTEGENWELDIHPNVSNSGKLSLPIIAPRKNEWGAEEDVEEDMFSKRTEPSEKSSHSSEYRGRSSGMGNVKAINDNWATHSESVASCPPKMSQLPAASERDLQAATKDSALMQKIEGLNAKIRVSDARTDSPNAYNTEEQRNSSPHGVIVPVGDKLIQPTAVVSRRSYHGGPGRVDHHGKGKYNSQDADGWKRKPHNAEPSSAVTVSKIEAASASIPAHVPGLAGEAAENTIMNLAGMNGDLAEPNDDSTDIQAQRAKMRELARQRALQLQKEEEERTREQKAKALAKLEELNRRTLLGEAANQKADESQGIADTLGMQEPHTSGPMMVDPKVEETKLNVVSHKDQSGESGEVSMPLEMQQKVLTESDAQNVDTKKLVSSQLNDGGTSRHKRTGYKQKQNHTTRRSSTESSAVNTVAAEAQKDRSTHVAAHDIKPVEAAPLSDTKPSGSNVLSTSSAVIEPSAHQRRKSNKSGKNKHKVDDNLPVPAFPLVPETNPGKDSSETNSQASFSNLDSSASTVIEPDRGVHSQGALSSLPNEDFKSRVVNQWKHHHPSRRMPRSQQPNRFMDKPHSHSSDSVIWAPVGTQNKAKDSVEAIQKPIQEPSNPKGADNMAQNNLKGRRAEMERYVPKPVAKELAQQGSVPPSSLSRSDEGQQLGIVSSASSQPQNSVEINDGDGKHKKEHGTWRQRGSTDSSHTKGVHLGPTQVSEPTKDVRFSKDQNQFSKREINVGNAETRTDDSNNVSKETVTATSSKNPATKDQGAAGRGKKYQPRVTRSFGNNIPDSENFSSVETDTNSGQSDVNLTDQTVVSKDNRSYGERTSSHWQPKSANNQHGNRASGSDSVTTEKNRLPKKEIGNYKPHHQAQSVKSNYKPHHQAQSVKSNESILGHPEDSYRERKGRPYSPNQGPVGFTDSAKTDEQFERNISSGSRRGGSQINRHVRSHESRGDWSSEAYRERPRQNAHYEYQPVGPYKSNKPENVEEPADSLGHQRYRERGQSHPKRGGNVQRRQSGAPRVASGQQDSLA